MAIDADGLVHDLKRAEALLAGEVRLLEMVAQGRPLRPVLEALSLLVEEIAVGCLCSILTVSPDRTRFRAIAGPSLPEAYNAMLDDLAIDPGYGPCSLAVTENRLVVTSDPRNDPRWAGSAWPGLMQAHDLGSCWSVPITSSSGETSGIFALYRRQPAAPSAEEQTLIDRFAKIAGIAIDRAKADETLRAREADLRDAHTLMAAEKHLLEMTATGCPLDEVLDAVCRFVEALSPECICGVYPIDWSGPVFKYGVAPSLPASYIDPIKGWPVAVDKAPCGIAVAENRQVIVVDVETDPTWGGTEYRDHVVSHDLRSVWSTLVRSLDGRILGSFCVYQRSPATPTLRHQELIARATHIAAIALDRARADEALMAREAELRRAYAQLSEGQRLSKTGSFTADLRQDRHEWSEEFFRIYEIDPTTPPGVQVVRDRVHPDDRPRFDAEIQRGIDGGDSDFLFRIVTPTAGLKYLHGAARVIEHVAGRPILMGTVQDITASKVSEEELQRSEAYLVEAQRLSKTGSFSLLLDTRDVVFSAELRRIFELADDAPATADVILSRVHPDDLALALDQNLAAQSGRDIDYEVRLQMPDGSIKYARILGHRVGNQAGRPELIGSVQDITETKLAEEALRRSAAYLLEGQRLSKTGSYYWLLDDGEPVLSDELRRIFGYDESEAVSFAGIWERIVPEDLPLMNERMEAARNGHDNDFVFRMRMPDGAIKYLRSFTQGARMQNGRLELIGSVQDMTESKLAEATLTASQAELRQAYDYLTEAQRLSRTGSFTWDVRADEHNWSGEIRRIFGFGPDVRVTMGMIQAAVHPEDMADVERVLGGAAEGRDFDLVFRILTTDGEVRYAHVVGHRIAHITDRPVFLGALQDVTERILGEEALNRARMQLAHVSRVTALSALTASIAHEVNQPLAGIMTNASTCLRMLAAHPPDTEGARATAQRTIRDANRASEVIKRLRALFARRSPGAEPVDLNDAAREVLVLSSAELQGARVVLHTDLADNLPILLGDRVQLQQVILNLVLNAAEAMRRIDDRPHDLWVSTMRDADGGVLLSVRDCGVGASPEQLGQLFDAFYTTRPEGMGVGLSISRSIIEAHDGRLWASANDGPGLTFFASLPVGAGAGEDPKTVGADTVPVSRSDNVQA